MPSHLTAYVFRQILRNRPLSHAHCSGLLPVLQRQRSHALLERQTNTSRHIFGWGSHAENQVQPLLIDPGIKQLAQLEEFLRMNSRPPPNEAISKALSELFAHKQKKQRALLDTDVHLALVALRYLLPQGEASAGLSTATLIYALQCLETKRPSSRTDETVELAQTLFEHLVKRLDAGADSQLDHVSQSDIIETYVRILSACHEGIKAREILRDAWSRNPEIFNDSRYWKPVLQALIRDQMDLELETTLDLMRKNGIPIGNDLQLSLLRAFAQQGNFSRAQTWHSLLTKNQSQSREADAIFLDLCITKWKLEAGKASFQRLLEREPDKSTWDLILRWAAATGKGVDEVERMMEVMTRRNAAANIPDRPDIATMNGLIKLAISLNDPYRAERFIALARKRGIHLNGDSYALQMEYRLGVNDIQGAYKAYQEMRSHEFSGDTDILQINSLVRSLCEADDLDMDAISDCISTLNSRKAELHPTTIISLCKVHLQQGEIQDLINLLHSHAFRLGSEHRHSITQIFKEYIMDERVSVSSAWDAYCIVRGLFTEMSNETRTQIMLSFFKRGHSDHAIHVFGNMRQAQVMSKRPSSEAYALCFQGLAHARDQDSFHLVYNMLKLDSEVEPDTYLRNALMLAMVRVGLARRALEVWEDIIYSREGPTYNSITLVLYAIEKTAMKVDPDEAVWTRLQNFGVEPTKDNFNAYVGALCGQLRTDDAVAKAEQMQNPGAAVDHTLIGVLYNSSQPEYRGRVEAWAKEKHPTIWNQLQTIGQDEKGKFKIQRIFKP